MSAELDPWVSYATHEDNKNFLSKSYGDDLYGVADSTHILFNQELTNREKRNFNARGYDVEMFTDVAKLDQAQTRPDALVPVKVPAGKRIEDGIFTFETAELQGTINLLDWMQQPAQEGGAARHLRQDNHQPRPHRAGKSAGHHRRAVALRCRA
jgi:hypothetical protein